MTRKNPPRKASKSPRESRYWLYGRHAVTAALNNPRRQHFRLLCTKNAANTLNPLPPNITPDIVDVPTLEAVLPAEAVHQGMALEVAPLPPTDLHEILHNPAVTHLVALDQVTDPHNVGAIMRSAAAFGVSAILTPQHHSAKETATLAKSASGALETVPLIEVSNLAQALKEAKTQDFWVIGLDGEAETAIDATPRYNKYLLVLGAEGKGLRRLTREHCDLHVAIPITSTIESLNVSNAAAIALYALQKN